MLKQITTLLTFSLLLINLLLTSGCGIKPLLHSVSVTPSTITPNADGINDVTRISYQLSNSADLSIALVSATNETHYFRYQRRRSIGSYRVDFSGVVNGSMLADGVYTWIITAEADNGEKSEITGTLTLQNADVEKPRLEGFSVYPNLFTPNRDGINDRVTINYYLTKEAEVKVYLIHPENNTRYPVAEKERDVKPGQPGFHTYDYEGGVDLGADPPPDGSYIVRAEAVDRVGNQTILTDSLTIAEGGVPRADIVNATVDFYNPLSGDRVVPLMQTLAFTLTVENGGLVPIRTMGPNVGTHYISNQNFNTKNFPQSSGVWRVAIDYEGNPGYAYPYRWAIGDLNQLEKRTINGKTEYFLLPGQRTIVTGTIQLVDIPAGKRDVVNFWAGLIHEDVAIQPFNDHVDPTPINIGF